MGYDLSYPDVDGFPFAGLVVRQREGVRRLSERRRSYQGPSTRLVRVAERDGWVCHLCGRLVPEDFERPTSPWAPSLDHIVPRRAGGTYAPSNVRLAHRFCNNRRMDLPVEECDRSMFEQLVLPGAA